MPTALNYIALGFSVIVGLTQAGAAVGQPAQTELVISIRDINGNPLSGVRVRVGSFPRTTITGSTGDVRYIGIAPKPATLTAELEGFVVSRKVEVPIIAAQTSSVALKMLRPGEMTQGGEGWELLASPAGVFVPRTNVGGGGGGCRNAQSHREPSYPIEQLRSVAEYRNEATRARPGPFSLRALGLYRDFTSIPTLKAHLKSPGPVGVSACLGLLLLGEADCSDELHTRLLAETADLRAASPDYSTWERVRFNGAIKEALSGFRFVSSNFLELPVRVLETHVELLVHPSEDVRRDARIVLETQTGVSLRAFDQSCIGFAKASPCDYRHRANWRTWWAANRDRHAAKKPYLSGGLSLHLKWEDAQTLTARIENHTDSAVPVLLVEGVAGNLMPTKSPPREPDLLFVSQTSNSDLQWCLTRARSANSFSGPTGRWKQGEIAANSSFSFPVLPTFLNDQRLSGHRNVELRYSACTKNGWCGDLVSNPVPITAK